MKKIGYLGAVLVCGLILTGCSSADTSKLEKQIDKISKSVDTLHERVDELSETGVDISATKNSSESKKETSTSDEKKDTKDSKETKASTDTKDSKEKSAKKEDLFAKNAVAKSDTVKLQVTKVDFIESVPESQTESKGLVVVYYTIENTGSENIQPSMVAPKYIIVSEEDDISDTRLTDSLLGLSYYKAFKELDDNSQLSIKPSAKIDAAVGYYIKNEDKNIKVEIGSYEFTPNEKDSVATKTFTTKEIAKAFKSNSKIKPE